MIGILLLLSIPTALWTASTYFWLSNVIETMDEYNLMYDHRWLARLMLFIHVVLPAGIIASYLGY